MNNDLRAGVLGLGRGESFVPVLQAMDGVSLAAVADMNAERLHAFGREHGIPLCFTTFEELLAADLDLIVVATPVAQHAEQAIAALEAGIHVISEIPTIGTREDAEQLVAAAEKSDAIYMSGENCNYWAYVNTLQRLNRRGDLGHVFAAEGEYIHNTASLRHDEHGNRTWRWYMAPITYITHSLGPIMWVTGQYPVEVTCMGTESNFEPGLIDLQCAIFRMTDNSVVRITCSFSNTHWGGHRQVFFGTKATFDSGWIGKDKPKFRYAGESAFTVPDNLPLGTTYPDAERSSGRGTAEWLMLADFLKAIRSGIAPALDVYEGVMHSLAGICAVESAAAGGSRWQFRSIRSGARDRLV
jgi:predicted dehydrogenase